MTAAASGRARGTTLVDRLAEARAAKAPSAFLAAVPYAHFLDIEATLKDDQLLFRLPFHRRLVGNPLLPALHGGATAALAEISATVILLWRHESERLPKNVTTTMDYRRMAGAADTYAAGEVTRLGRQLATVQVTLWQEARDKPVAVGQTHFLLT